MKSSRGFNLLELVIVVAIISLITAVVVPNVLDALDRSRRSSTQADMRSIANALERYAADHRGYPVVPLLGELRPEFVPEYLKSLPTRDGWGNPLVYEAGNRGATYVLRSPGKDGLFEAVPEAESFDVDLVIVDGAFVVPEPASNDDPPTSPIGAAG